jgi:hypothetical protein
VQSSYRRRPTARRPVEIIAVDYFIDLVVVGISTLHELLEYRR